MSAIPTIEIKEFIFHVVHNGQKEPFLMDETPLGKFEAFFVERITEIMEGNSFFFDPKSEFLAEIKELEKKPAKFVETSKGFAKRFHSMDKRIKAGVMILMKAVINKKVKYVLIKYDHEDVVYYETLTTKHKAILREISNTFSKSKGALQKSAIIDLNGRKPTVVIIDKSDRSNVTDFFKEFLGIVRVYSDAELANKVRDAFKSTVKMFRASLPEEITTQISRKFNTAAMNNREFEPTEFIRAAIGADCTPEMQEKFLKELRNQDIQGESFVFQDNIQPATFTRYRTAEGISIRIPNEASDTVNISKEGNRSIITITSTRIDEE